MIFKGKRLAAGVSQIKLAYEAKVSRYRIVLAEQGYIKLRPEELSSIETALKKISSRKKGPSNE